jgi:hypothetical protein
VRSRDVPQVQSLKGCRRHFDDAKAESIASVLIAGCQLVRLERAQDPRNAALIEVHKLRDLSNASTARFIGERTQDRDSVLNRFGGPI